MSNKSVSVRLALAAAGLGLLLAACGAGSTPTAAPTGPSAARSETSVPGSRPSSTATKADVSTGVPMSPEAVGVEGLPEGNVAPGLDAEDAVDTGPVPTETAGASSAVSKSFQIDFNQFFQLIPRDAIFPFYDPEFVSADAANLDDGELVIGVEINGEARAYPIGPLNRREMVNDRVGGVPILVTW